MGNHIIIRALYISDHRLEINRNPLITRQLVRTQSEPSQSHCCSQERTGSSAAATHPSQLMSTYDPSSNEQWPSDMAL